LQPSIDAHDVENFFQMVIGSFTQSDDYVDRLLTVMEKSVREAKVSTSWRKPNDPYEKKVASFVRRALNDASFMQDVIALEKRIAPAALANSLGRVVLKIFTPGVPDFYQGTEDFTYRLVDPDNRAPASFDATGVKYDLIKRCLALPREGPYEPLEVTGPATDHVIAFRRGPVRVVASRFVLRLRDWGKTRIKGGPLIGDLLADLPVAVD
jgi:(1->4)-alpha-D-glucan 1-alpha-D-glucosylmutase